jgi:hypothetical protein
MTSDDKERHTVSNTTIAIAYRNRMVVILKKMLEHREDVKELRLDMRKKGFSDIEIAGVRLAATRALWDQKRRERLEAIGQYALALEGDAP